MTLCKIISILLFSLTIISCSDESKPPSPPKHSDNFDALWQQNINAALAEPLWQYEYAYDASASLMVPMHYAFKHHARFDMDPREKFKELMEKSYLHIDLSSYEGGVTRSQYLYFMSQYLMLAEELDETELEMLDWVTKRVIETWLETPAFHWDKKLNLIGVKGRLEWNLSEPDTDFSFYRAVIDEDWFTLASLNDLAVVYKKNSISLPFDNESVKELSKSVLNRFGSFEGDHRDYAYAGQVEITPHMERAYIKSIGIDSSHMHRLPLWLDSFMRNNEFEVMFFEKIKHGFRRAYEEHVLVYSGEQKFLLLQNNYTTGENGVFRYNYETQGLRRGYEAFELSGTLFIGYYVFMNSSLYEQGMELMKTEYPLSNQALSYYVGPNSTRLRHPLFKWPDYFENGFAEIFTRVVACYNTTVESCDS